MPACVILVGLPASGKTTFYRERFAGTHDHVSKDVLKNSRSPERRQRQLLAEVAIFTARKRLEPPSREEGIDRLYTVKLIENERRFDIVEF